MWQLYDIHIFLSINKILVNYSHADSFISLAAFMPQWQSHRDYMTHKPKNSYEVAFYRKCLPTPGLHNTSYISVILNSLFSV